MCLEPRRYITLSHPLATKWRGWAANRRSSPCSAEAAFRRFRTKSLSMAISATGMFRAVFPSAEAGSTIGRLTYGAAGKGQSVNHNPVAERLFQFDGDRRRRIAGTVEESRLRDGGERHRHLGLGDHHLRATQAVAHGRTAVAGLFCDQQM